MYVEAGSHPLCTASNGSVDIWGRGDNGQGLGDDWSSKLVRVNWAPKRSSSPSRSGPWTLIVRDWRWLSVYTCTWGDNGRGQLGMGVLEADLPMLVSVLDGPKLVKYQD